MGCYFLSASKTELQREGNLKASGDNPEKIPVIEARGVGVKFNPRERREDLKTLAHNLLHRQENREEFWALKNIDLTVYCGDIIGVVGFNGAGKTTLCRVIAGLLQPDQGEIQVAGEVSALLSLGTGFNRELTGRENIYLNGMMLGFPRKEIERLCPEIVEFSGLGDFIDEPIKIYSRGMRARLGFSIAAMIKPEILVLDEALSAGDLEFSERAAAKTKEILGQTRAVVLVSHNIDYIENHCTKAIWMEKGEIKACGDPKKVCSLYRQKVEERKARRRKISFFRLEKTRSRIGDEVAVELENLGVYFSLGQKTLWALEDINLTIRSGEVVGIIGHNGAGKTTLCRVLGGLLKADRGKVKVNGEVLALLSLGAGFNRHLSGRDNIYLNGLMLGMSLKEIAALYDDIVAFSELGEFIDTPVKYYSSGMLSRLGFSIAAATEPAIFVIDEALSTGDASFNEKAGERIQEMISGSKAVIVVSHSLPFIQKVCTRALWMKKGRVLYDGSPEEAVTLYRKDVKKKEA